MKIKDLFYLRSLLSIDGIGINKILSLIKIFESFENIFSAKKNQIMTIPGISFVLTEKILSAKEVLNNIVGKLQKEFEYYEKNNISILTYWDKNYPDFLRNIYYPPLILYVSGNYDFSPTKCLAVVGTRTPTEYGVRQAEQFCKDLTLNGFSLVSGMARGIDTIAHKSALKYGGKTLAVLGSGINVIYPPENKKLFENIVNSGCVVSEYPKDTKPDARNFPKRNRIISGLSVGTVVIETRKNGGALQTAKYALDQGREVFALPGNNGVQQSEGTNLLLKLGHAKLIQKSEDIFEEFGMSKTLPLKNSPQSPPGLNPQEKKIFDLLSNDNLHIDKISEQTNIPTSDCLVQLLSLEFKGHIIQLPGKQFKRV